MNESVYIVKSGDSLSKIARAHGTTALSIARLNNITHIDVIRVGQHLRIPSRSANTSRTTILATPSVAPAGHDSDDEEESSSLWIRFVDAFQQPIQQFKASVQAGTKLVEHLTDASGYLPRIDLATGSAVTVAVEKIAGSTKKVAELVAANGHQHVLLTSPKATVASSQHVHDGPKRPTSPPSPQPPGTFEITRSPSGNPVQQVAVECPNTDNLCLKANFKYRDIILEASKRSGYKPQAIAAIMNAEAATIITTELLPVIGKDGNPVIDKKTGRPKVRKLTRNTGEWNEKSASPLSSARGMTQFLDGSWIDQAVTDGTYLNAKAKSEGWLTTTTVQNGKSSKTIPAFKKSDCTLVTASAKRSLARVLSSKPNMVGRAMASDANLQTLLDLRFKAEFAIHAAVDYGLQNMKALSSAGYKTNSLSDAEKAKIVYLCHHLGVADAKHFIDDTMTEAHAKYLLEQQLGKSTAAEKANGKQDKYLEAHREWLAGYIDGRIALRYFNCSTFSSDSDNSLFDILLNVKK